MELGVFSIAVIAVVGYLLLGDAVKKLGNTTVNVVDRVADKSGDVLVKTVDTVGIVADTTLEIAADTVPTYAHEVYVSNAEKRKELAEKYQAIGEIISVNKLDELRDAAIRTKQPAA